jgi:hypothetical protein
VSDDAILAASGWLLDQGVHAGLESACAVAAAHRALETGRCTAPLVLLTGHYAHALEEALPGEPEPLRVDSLEPLMAALRELGVCA